MAKKEKPKVNLKQRKVAKAIIENHGTSVSKAMRDAGYSDAYASNPQELIRTKSFQELLDEYLPDEKLAQVHAELIDNEEANIRLRSVDLGYKIKSKFEPDKIEVIKKYEDMPYEELEKLYEQRTKETKTD